MSAATVATVCMPCWLAWDPNRTDLSEHPKRKCRVRWVENNKVTVCMCACARTSPSNCSAASAESLSTSPSGDSGASA